MPSCILLYLKMKGKWNNTHDNVGKWATIEHFYFPHLCFFIFRTSSCSFSTYYHNHLDEWEVEMLKDLEVPQNLMLREMQNECVCIVVLYSMKKVGSHFWQKWPLDHALPLLKLLFSNPKIGWYGPIFLSPQIKIL